VKAWWGYGSEHSMNLVMIGRFEELKDALKAKDVIDKLTEHVTNSERGSGRQVGEELERFTDQELELLRTVNFHSVRPEELEQFGYDVAVKLDDKQIVLTTDEIDVSAFLKVLIDHGAFVEVFSAHQHEGTEKERRK